MSNSRLFGIPSGPGSALHGGKPQNETMHANKPIIENLHAEQTFWGEFLDAMTGLQAASFQPHAEKFDFTRYATVSDIDGALALLSRIVGARHSRLSFASSAGATIAYKH